MEESTTGTRKFLKALKTFRKKSSFHALVLWFASNGITIGILAGGYLLEYGFMEFIGIILFSILNILAVLLWIVFALIKHITSPIDLYDTARGEEKPANGSPLDMDILRDFSKGTVPIWLDKLYDLGVVGLMISFGYHWLPLFYIIHILAIIKIREITTELIEEEEIRRTSVGESMTNDNYQGVENGRNTVQ